MPVGLPPSPTRQDSLLKVHEAKLKEAEVVVEAPAPQVDGKGKDWKERLPKLKHTAFKEDDEEEEGEAPVMDAIQALKHTYTRTLTHTHTHLHTLTHTYTLIGLACRSAPEGEHH
jgi:hypothetical protein